MSKRKYIDDNIDSLKINTLRKFGCMLYTDIYEYADFALGYNIDTNLVIEEIFVYEREKSALYIGENSKIPNSAKWFDPNTNQGLLYIKRTDIYYRLGNERVYRYFKCPGLYQTSKEDEHFSHFSEDDRIR